MRTHGLLFGNGYTLAALVRLGYRRFVHYWKRTANMMIGTFYVNRIEVCR